MRKIRKAKKQDARVILDALRNDTDQLLRVTDALLSR